MTWLAFLAGALIAGMCANHNASNRYEMVADSIGILGGISLAVAAMYFHFH